MVWVLAETTGVVVELMSGQQREGGLVCSGGKMQPGVHAIVLIC
jgi:hypothetical protein